MSDFVNKDGRCSSVVAKSTRDLGSKLNPEEEEGKMLSSENEKWGQTSSGRVNLHIFFYLYNKKNHI